jgi:hypothetical protein
MTDRFSKFLIALSFAVLAILALGHTAFDCWLMYKAQSDSPFTVAPPSSAQLEAERAVARACSAAVPVRPSPPHVQGEVSR